MKSECKKCGENLRQLASVSTICDEDCRLQNSPYFCIFKYARAVKQEVWNEAENRERDWGETLKIRACEARELRARKTLTPRFTDFFTDFEEKKRVFCSVLRSLQFIQFYPSL